VRIPHRLRSLRIAAGLSQEALAAKTDLSQRTISRLEAGHVAPNRSTLRLLADALGVTIDDLFEKNGDEAA